MSRSLHYQQTCILKAQQIMDTLDKVVCEADEAVLDWRGNDNDDLEKALEGHPNLTRLTIKNIEGTSFGDWMIGINSTSLDRLVTLHLCNGTHCVSLPPLGDLPSLVHLSVKNFNSLEIVGPEFYGEMNSSSQFAPFQALKILEFEDLPEWRTWVVTGEFPVLEELYLRDCPKLVGRLPAKLASLRKLEILGCRALKISLPQLPKICDLKLQNCERVDLTSLAHVSSSLTSLDLSFDSYTESPVPAKGLQRLTSLTELKMVGCSRLFNNIEEVQFPCTLKTLIIISHIRHNYLDADEPLPSCQLLGGRGIPSLSSLTSLSIGGFKMEVNLPMPVISISSSYRSLQHLSISDCRFPSIYLFPLCHFPLLEYLEIKNCPGLESFDLIDSPEEISLKELSLENCPDLFYFPPGERFSAPKLKTLSITKCKNLLYLPQRMATYFTSLQSLSIKNCPLIDLFGNRNGLPTSLQKLSIIYCKNFTSHLSLKQWKLDHLAFLTRLEIQGCQDMECFPPLRGWLPLSLTSLTIAHFPNLKRLIGEDLRHLTFLQELEIVFCPNLSSLPHGGRPPSLRSLRMSLCPSLQEPCDGWPHISPAAPIDLQCAK